MATFSRIVAIVCTIIIGLWLGNLIGIVMGADCHYDSNGDWTCPTSDNAFNPPVLNPIVPQGMECENVYVEVEKGIFKWVRVCS